MPQSFDFATLEAISANPLKNYSLILKVASSTFRKLLQMGNQGVISQEWINAKPVFRKYFIGEQVNLGTQSHPNYYQIDQNDLFLNIDAILLSESADLKSELMEKINPELMERYFDIGLSMAHSLLTSSAQSATPASTGFSTRFGFFPLPFPPSNVALGAQTTTAGLNRNSGFNPGGAR